MKDAFHYAKNLGLSEMEILARSDWSICYKLMAFFCVCF